MPWTKSSVSYQDLHLRTQSLAFKGASLFKPRSHFSFELKVRYFEDDRSKKSLCMLLITMVTNLEVDLKGYSSVADSLLLHVHAVNHPGKPYIINPL